MHGLERIAVRKDTVNSFRSGEQRVHSDETLEAQRKQNELTDQSVPVEEVSASINFCYIDGCENPAAVLDVCSYADWQGRLVGCGKSICSDHQKRNCLARPSSRHTPTFSYAKEPIACEHCYVDALRANFMKLGILVALIFAVVLIMVITFKLL